MQEKKGGKKGGKENFPPTYPTGNKRRGGTITEKRVLFPKERKLDHLAPKPLLLKKG